MRTYLPGAVLGLIASTALATENTDDLTSLSIEQLLTIEVTIVSKSGERFADAAAAVTVITQEDIRRSGATSFPEALRMAPGLHVSRVSSNIWEVSSRGFSSSNSAKLLVLIDGRSVYTPLFSGVAWDVQDTLFEDIDRIEVIRGPGASVWGSNAMNGVINILTRSAKDTQGTYVEAGGGNEHRGFAAARYGGELATGVYYRVYGKAFADDGSHNPLGPDDDDWRMGRLGFRVDAELGPADTLTFQGEGYLGKVGQVTPALTIIGRPPPTGTLAVAVAGGNVNGTFTHRFGERAGSTPSCAGSTPSRVPIRPCR
jgi:iron complex outermembrane recepter protein